MTKNFLSSRKLVMWTLGNPSNKDDDDDDYFAQERKRLIKDNGVNINDNSNYPVKFPDRNIWICSTNFPITESHYNKIARHYSRIGIEIMKVPATYTMLFSTNMFSDEDKMKLCIERLLGATRQN